MLGSGSGSLSLPRGMDQVEDGDDDEGIWETPGYARASQRLLIRIVDIGSGSVTIGHNCTFGGQAATVGHIKIGDNCTFAGRAGIISDTPSNSIMAGFPAQPHMDWLRQQANLRKVNSMVQRLKALEKELAQLKK